MPILNIMSAIDEVFTGSTKKNNLCKKTKFNPSDLRHILNIQKGLEDQIIHDPPSKHAQDKQIPYPGEKNHPDSGGNRNRCNKHLQRTLRQGFLGIRKIGQ